MFSQYEEERYIQEALAETPPARFLDIGAWNAKVFSNTRALVEKGWGGALFEPSPGPLIGLIDTYQDHQGITVVSAAVTVEGGLVKMRITDDAVSMPADMAARISEWEESVKFLGFLTVPSLSVREVFNQFGTNVEMVSIDTEGTSVDIFAEMCRLGPRPRCVVVEHDSRFVECSNIAQAANYALVHENGTNRVYRWTGGRE